MIGNSKINQGVAVVKVEPVRKTKVPFKPEPESIPEIDFEITEYTLPANGVLHFPTYGKKTHQLKGADNKSYKSQKEVDGNKSQEKTYVNGKTIKEKKDSNPKSVPTFAIKARRKAKENLSEGNKIHHE